jgi:argininosuccinate lyase
MDEVAGGLKTVVEHLEAKGVLTASDTKAIVNALEHLKVDSSPQAPRVQKALSGPYWEARNRALHDRKFHP